MRVKSKWNLRERERSLAETGGAIAFILWRIAQQGAAKPEPTKAAYARDTDLRTLEDIVAGADLFLGVSATDSVFLP